MGFIGAGTSQSNYTFNALSIQIIDNIIKYINYWWNNDYSANAGDLISSQIITFKHTTGATRNIYVNGTEISGSLSGTSNSVNSSQTQFNNFIGYAGHDGIYFNGKMKSLFIVPSALSDSERNILESTPVIAASSYLPLVANTTDIGSNPQTVTTSGSITYTTIDGKQCAYFNNPTGLANRIYFNFTNSSKFTLSYWVYVVSSGAQDFTACSIINPSFADATQVLADYYVNNTMDLYVALPNQWRNTANSSNNCTYDQWKHIAYSIDQTSYVTTLYIDGTLIKSITGTGAFPGSSFILTLGCAGNGRGFNGYIRQFQYYTSILTNSQIQNLYTIM